ncbi:MAG: hypothetical protein WB536_00560 [Terriglobales bacterium]
MTSVFQQAYAVGQAGNLLARISFYMRETGGLLLGALRERARGIFGNQGIPFRRFDMRLEFRFPRSTVFLMVLIFAGVVLTISKASGIESKYGSSSAVWPSLVLTLATVASLALASAGLIWGILFALQRTGVHRLADLETHSNEPGQH